MLQPPFLANAAKWQYPKGAAAWHNEILRRAKRRRREL
jgi:hypothetical protein